MNQLIVRKLNPEVVAARGKSSRTLKDLLLSMPNVGEDRDFKRSKDRRVHNLTLATRNVKDVERTGVSLVNPFDPD